MIVSVVSMPEGIVTRTDVAEARARLAASDFLLVDIELPDEEPPGGQSVISLLGLDPERLFWFGDAGAPARAEFFGDSAAFVVPVVEDNRITHLHALATEQHLITVHRGPSTPLNSLVARLPQERPADAPAVLFLLLQEALQTFRRAAVSGLLTVEDLEDDMFEKRRPEQVYRLARLRRRAALLHRALLPYLQVTDEVLTRRLLSGNFPEQRQRLAQEFRNAGRMVLTDVESFQDATRRAFASYSSLVAGEQNGVINRLTIVSVIFLPLSFLTGFFGMNFTYLTDELESKAVFWLLAIGLQVCVLLASFYVLRRTHLWRRLHDEDETQDE
jgi:magnesium transporter